MGEILYQFDLLGLHHQIPGFGEGIENARGSPASLKNLQFPGELVGPEPVQS